MLARAGSDFDDDADFWRLFRAGDRRAMEQVYQANVEWLTRFVSANARRAGVRGAGEDVSDIVQETFARVLDDRSRASFDPARPFRPYLANVARHVVIDSVRRARRRPAVAAVAAALVPAVAEDDARLMEAVLAQVTARARELPPELRSTYQAVFVDGLSQRRAAVSLGVGRQVVRTRAGLVERWLQRLAGRWGNPTPSLERNQG
jgi:RNA polymerase sigma factor (sigma-70 family)